MRAKPAAKAGLGTWPFQTAGTLRFDHIEDGKEEEEEEKMKETHKERATHTHNCEWVVGKMWRKEGRNRKKTIESNS